MDTVIAPLGCLSKVDDLLIATVAGATYWQTWTKTSSAAEARAHVWLKGLPYPEDVEDELSNPELVNLRPLAIVFGDLESSYNFTHIAQSGAFDFANGNNQFILFEDNVPQQFRRHPHNLDRWFKNQVGQVLDDMFALAGAAGYLAITNFVASEVQRSVDVKDSEGDYLQITVQVTSGQFAE